MPCRHETLKFFNEQNEESQIQLASLAYTSIDDNKVQLSDADLKAKYNEMKPRFKQFVESRDIKYIDIQVKASASDVAALQKEFAAYDKDLAAAADPSDVVRTIVFVFSPNVQKYFCNLQTFSCNS